MKEMFKLIASTCCLLMVTCLLASDAKTEDKPIVFPEATGRVSINPITVPESFLIRMSKSKNVTDFLSLIEKEFEDKNSGKDKGRPVLTGNGTTVWGRRQGYDASILKSVASAAGCEVELKAVEVEKSEDPSVISFPSCTRLPRCGGCCTSSFLECVPVQKTQTDVNVMQVRYKSEDDFDILGVKSFRMETHVKCKCECRERAEHCNADQQIYVKNECRCECKNRKARELCKGSNKFWDSKDCACKCLNEDECSTGFFYNPITCKCELMRSSRVVSIRGRIGSPVLANPRAGGPANKNEGETQIGKDIGIRPSDDVGLYRMASLQNKQKPYAIPTPPIQEQP